MVLLKSMHGNVLRLIVVSVGSKNDQHHDKNSVRVYKKDNKGICEKRFFRVHHIFNESLFLIHTYDLYRQNVSNI